MVRRKPAALCLIRPCLFWPRQGIGNGLPLAAVVTTPEVAATLAQRLHFNTYGGNPVCCAGGRAVLRAVDEDGVQANAAHVRLFLSGSSLLTELRTCCRWALFFAALCACCAMLPACAAMLLPARAV
jgi:glutamate-1-semialdehyde aminotransferase